MKRLKRIAPLTGLLLALSAPAFAQVSPVPNTMNFQGRLAKPDGTPLPDNAAQPVTFRLFSAATGGTALWSQTGNVAVHNGAFAAVLDFSAGFSGANTLASVFAASPYLEIQIGSGVPLAPRQLFRSVAYAFNANTANTVPNGSIGLTQLANGLLSFSNISGQITGSQIAAGTITTSNFASSVLPGLTPTQQAILARFGLGTSRGTVSVTPVGATPNHIAVSGNYAYVVNRGSSALQIFDVSNPVNPVLVNAPGTATGNQPGFITVSGTYAYVTGNSNTLQIFDVSNPASPVLKSATATGAAPSQTVVVGNYAYIACYSSNTLQIFNVSNPASPVLVNGPNGAATGNNPDFLAVAGNYAYITNSGSNTLQVFDVSNPASPVLKSSTGTGGAPYQIVVNGNYAYLVCYDSSTLQVFNISNPLAPTLVNGPNGATTGANPIFMAVSGNYAYVANSNGNTLQVFDVSNPAGPVLSATLTTGTNPKGVAVSGANIYVVNGGSNTLQIFGPSGAVTVSGNLNVSGDIYANGQLYTPFTLPYSGSLSSDSQAGITVSNTGNAISASSSLATYASIYGYNTTTGNIGYFSGGDGVGSFGVYGSANGVSGSGVFGASDKGYGVQGQSAHGYGVYGGSNNGNGVYGSSDSSNGVLGQSVNGAGVSGFSASGDGVFGFSTSGDGVVGYSTSGYGVHGTSFSNYAGYFDGNVYISGTLKINATTYTSDARYKTHISTLHNALDNLLNLRGVSYDWNRAQWPEKRFPEGGQVGFLAQELEKVFPDLVQTDKDGYKSVNYIGVVPVLVEAVKTQQGQIDALKAKVAALETQNEALKTQNDAIEELKKQVAALVAAAQKAQTQTNEGRK